LCHISLTNRCDFYWTPSVHTAAHDSKEYMGRGGIAPLILNLGTRWRSVVNLTPQPLYPGERAPSTHQYEGWLSPYGCSVKSLNTTQIRTLGHPGHRKTTIPGIFRYGTYYNGVRGGIVDKALRYKLAGRGFDSRGCHWNFSVI
jgi:hypothetical protein